MTLLEAKELLKNNCLDLSNAGMDRIPVKTVDIESFTYFKDNDEKYADLIGLIKKGECKSFLIKVRHLHYYADYFSGAMEILQALRLVNEWVNPFEEECCTIVF